MLSIFIYIFKQITLYFSLHQQKIRCHLAATAYLLKPGKQFLNKEYMMGKSLSFYFFQYGIRLQYIIIVVLF